MRFLIRVEVGQSDKILVLYTILLLLLLYTLTSLPRPPTLPFSLFFFVSLFPPSSLCPTLPHSHTKYWSKSLNLSLQPSPVALEQRQLQENRTKSELFTTDSWNQARCPPHNESSANCTASHYFLQDQCLFFLLWIWYLRLIPPCSVQWLELCCASKNSFEWKRSLKVCALGSSINHIALVTRWGGYNLNMTYLEVTELPEIVCKH